MWAFTLIKSFKSKQIIACLLVPKQFKAKIWLDDGKFFADTFRHSHLKLVKTGETRSSQQPLVRSIQIKKKKQGLLCILNDFRFISEEKVEGVALAADATKTGARNEALL